ncbi:hypothetical protein [Paenibacillus sp. YSY-4.3]
MRELLLNYWIKPLPQMSEKILPRARENQTKTRIIIAFFSALTALLQSAGGFLPGPGYLISPFSTAPIVLSTLISLRSGLTAHALSCLLLLLIQPSELIVFPFTTGLLGLALGFGITHLKNRIQVILFSSVALWMGIALVVYAFRFPILGPTVPINFQIDISVYVILFCLLYSGIWAEISLRLLARLKKAVQE